MDVHGSRAMTLRTRAVIDRRCVLGDDVLRDITGDPDQVALCVALRITEAEIAIPNTAKQNRRAAGVALCHCCPRVRAGTPFYRFDRCGFRCASEDTYI